MTVTPVSPLGRRRRRRERRHRIARALYAADSDRAALLPDLRLAISIAGGDKAAIVWGYGFDDLFQIHTILDLASDVPRRDIWPEPLELARLDDHPGFGDVPDRGARTARGVPRSGCALTLGSDDRRQWFLTVDGLSPRGPLADSRRAGRRR